MRVPRKKSSLAADLLGMCKDTLIMLLITVIAGLLLGLVYQITKDPIARQQELAKQEACKEVFSDAATFGQIDVAAYEGAAWSDAGFALESINEVMEAGSETGEILGYVITVTTKEGYGGDIKFSIGIREDGTVNGISLLSISETAGLGMRADEVLKPQFADKKAERFEYTKSGSVSDYQIDAISGATITTNAVVNGVNAGLYYFQTQLKGGGTNE